MGDGLGVFLRSNKKRCVVVQTLKDDVRRKIMRAALREFSRKGFAKASMRSIALQAEVGVGNLYNYFPSKDRLFCDILAPLVSSFYSMLEKHHGEYADALAMMQEEYLLATVSEYVELLRGNRTLMEILFGGAQGSSLERFKIEFTDKATELVKKWFESNKAKYPQMNIRVSDFTVHLHTVWMFTMFEELLRHPVSRQDVETVLSEYIMFEIQGWKAVFRI